MKNLLALVSLICLLTFSLAVTVRDNENYYEPESKSYTYSDSVLTPDASEQDEQLQYYKAARRSERVPTLQYRIPEDASPEVDYNYSTQQQQQPLEATPRTSNYEYQQQLTKRLGLVAVKKPLVEQYLKEVSPTTKTAYNRRAGNYLRPNGQAAARANKQTEESQRGILKQSPFQYILPQKPQTQQQIQYEIAEQKPIQPHYITQHQQSEISDLSRYQNALLAHQKVLLETSQDESSKSSIYVNHAVPKKPVRKLVKHKQPPVDGDVEYYAQLQQQYQQLQQKPSQFYEQQQPAQVMYQMKLQQPKEDDASLEERLTYQQQPKQYQPQVLQYQPPTTTRQGKKQRRPVKYQQDYQTIQEGHDPSYEYQTKSEERPTPLRQGPKYLPEPKTVRYQPSPLEAVVYQQVVNPGQQQPLITYEAAIAKFQSEQHRPRPQNNEQQQASYREQEVQSYAEENQQGTNQDTEIEYVRPDQASRLRVGARGVVYRQPQGSNVRYYRNLGRPVQYASYE